MLKAELQHDSWKHGDNRGQRYFVHKNKGSEDGENVVYVKGCKYFSTSVA